MGCHCPVLLIVRILQLLLSFVVLAATSVIVHKFSDARQFIDQLDFLKPWIRHLIDYVLSTPHRIYLGMFASIWTILVALCIIIIPRWRKGRFAPYAAMIALEITTTIFWLCAFIGLALFAVEVKPLCFLADETLIVKRMIESCVIIKTATALAGVSWVLWSTTWITIIVQACRSRRDKRRSPVPDSELVTYTQRNWTPAQGDMPKAEYGVLVTTVEMPPRYP